MLNYYTSKNMDSGLKILGDLKSRTGSIPVLGTKYLKSLGKDRYRSTRRAPFPFPSITHGDMWVTEVFLQPTPNASI